MEILLCGDLRPVPELELDGSLSHTTLLEQRPDGVTEVVDSHGPANSRSLHRGFERFRGDAYGTTRAIPKHKSPRESLCPL